MSNAGGGKPSLSLDSHHLKIEAQQQRWLEMAVADVHKQQHYLVKDRARRRANTLFQSRNKNGGRNTGGSRHADPRGAERPQDEGNNDDAPAVEYNKQVAESAVELEERLDWVLQKFKSLGAGDQEGRLEMPPALRPSVGSLGSLPTSGSAASLTPDVAGPVMDAVDLVVTVLSRGFTPKDGTVTPFSSPPRDQGNLTPPNQRGSFALQRQHSTSQHVGSGASTPNSSAGGYGGLEAQQLSEYFTGNQVLNNAGKGPPGSSSGPPSPQPQLSTHLSPTPSTTATAALEIGIARRLIARGGVQSIVDFLSQILTDQGMDVPEGVVMQLVRVLVCTVALVDEQHVAHRPSLSNVGGLAGRLDQLLEAKHSVYTLLLQLARHYARVGTSNKELGGILRVVVDGIRLLWSHHRNNKEVTSPTVGSTVSGASGGAAFNATSCDSFTSAASAALRPRPQASGSFEVCSFVRAMERFGDSNALSTFSTVSPTLPPPSAPTKKKTKASLVLGLAAGLGRLDSSEPSTPTTTMAAELIGSLLQDVQRRNLRGGMMLMHDLALSLMRSLQQQVPGALNLTTGTSPGSNHSASTEGRATTASQEEVLIGCVTALGDVLTLGTISEPPGPSWGRCPSLLKPKNNSSHNETLYRAFWDDQYQLGLNAVHCYAQWVLASLVRSQQNQNHAELARVEKMMGQLQLEWFDAIVLVLVGRSGPFTSTHSGAAASPTVAPTPPTADPDVTLLCLQTLHCFLALDWNYRGRGNGEDEEGPGGLYESNAQACQALMEYLGGGGGNATGGVALLDLLSDAIEEQSASIGLPDAE